MARPKKITTPASTDLSKVGIHPAEEAAKELNEMLGIPEGVTLAQYAGPAPAKRGDIIQIDPSDKEAKHPLMANIMIVHEVNEDGALVCYQPGRAGFPVKRIVDAVDALVVGQAKLKYPEGKALPAGEKPAYDHPLDKI
jgi:hypothetical protein